MRENNRFNDATTSSRVIGNFSGGVASAIACYLALEEFDNIHLAFMNTNLENPDTFRFIKDFEKLTGEKVNIYQSSKFHDPESIWRKYLGLNFAHGAPCSTVLKRDLRIEIQDTKTDYAQIFGFDYCKKELRRADGMARNYPEINPIFPLIEQKITREMLFDMCRDIGLNPPIVYNDFLNNNCIGDYNDVRGGCVQGGIGYWQKIKRLFPHKYEYMANLEHELTELKRQKLINEEKYTESEFLPVTICKDQRNLTKGNRMFLKLNDKMPQIGCIDEIKGRQPVTVFECNGICNSDLFTDT